MLAGRLKLTRALWSPGCTEVMVGAPGTVVVVAPAAVAPIGASTASAVPSTATPPTPAFHPRGPTNERNVLVMRFPL